jgi:hypothetical protein
MFGVAVGLTLGIVTRHTITAMAGTLGAFAVARFAGDTVRHAWLNLLPTDRVVDPINMPEADRNPDLLTIHTGYLTKGGNVLSDEGPLKACVEQNHRNGDPTTCYPKLGVTHHYADVLGGGQYWTAQLVETALFAGVATVLLVIAIGLLRKRSL